MIRIKKKTYLKEKKKTKMFTMKMMKLRRDAINDIKFHKFYPKCTFIIDDITFIDGREYKNEKENITEK